MSGEREQGEDRLRLAEARVDAPKGSASVPSLPADAPLLSLADVGGYLRCSRAAIKKRMSRRSGDLGEALCRYRVMIDGRWYVNRELFLAWLEKQSSTAMSINR